MENKMPTAEEIERLIAIEKRFAAFAKERATANRKNAIRTCGFCGAIGHDRRTCKLKREKQGA